MVVAATCPSQGGQMVLGLAPLLPPTLWGLNPHGSHLKDHTQCIVMLLILHNHHPSH
jgi:hypothetical protein